MQEIAKGIYPFKIGLGNLAHRCQLNIKLENNLGYNSDFKR
jgi:hypothetical protein